MVSPASSSSAFTRRLGRTVKRHLLARLPWMRKGGSRGATAYEHLPACDAHQAEVDENALNEALERRLAEIIAASPAQQQQQQQQQEQDHRLLVHRQVQKQQQQQVSVPADPAELLLILASSSSSSSSQSSPALICVTRCQDAQPQV